MTLTTFGSLVGLATGVFTVWDRWLRWRPIAYTVAKTNQGGPYIRIKNVGPMDIVVQRIESRPSTFKIAKGKGVSVKEVADAMVDKLEPTAIAPQETHDFFFWERRAVDAPRSRGFLYTGARRVRLGCGRSQLYLVSSKARLTTTDPPIARAAAAHAPAPAGGSGGAGIARHGSS